MPEIARIINDGKNWNSNVCKVTVVASVTKCACSGTSHTTTALVCKISKKCIKEGLHEDNTRIVVMIRNDLSLLSHQFKPKYLNLYISTYHNHSRPILNTFRLNPSKLTQTYSKVSEPI